MPDLRARIERSIQLSNSPVTDHSMDTFIIAQRFVFALIDDELLPDELEAAAVLGVSQALRRRDDFRRLDWFELAGIVEPIVAQLIQDTENADA